MLVFFAFYFSFFLFHINFLQSPSEPLINEIRGQRSTERRYYLLDPEGAPTIGPSVFTITQAGEFPLVHR